MRILLAALVLGCAPAHAPRAPAGGLSVGAEKPAVEGPFRVAFAAPKGALDDGVPGEITVVFSRPMQALDGGAAPLAATVKRGETVVPGQWRWFGTRTAVFRFAETVPYASEFEVTVEGAARALDGATLGAPYVFSFATARPRVTGATYRTDLAAPGKYPVDVELNQNTTRAEIRRAIRFEARKNGERLSVPFRVESEGEPTSAFVADLDTIAGLEDVVLLADPSLRGAEGPLAAGAAARVAIPEIGPLKASFTCTRTPTKACDTEAGATLEFSKPVRADSLAARVVLPGGKRVVPAEIGESAERLWVYDMRPGVKERVVVKAGVVATDGEVLARDQVFDVDGADLAPALSWGTANGTVVEAARPELSFLIASLNVPAYDAARAPVDEQALPAFLFKAPTMAQIRALPAAAVSTIAPRGPKNAWAQSRVPIAPEIRAGGAFAVGLSSGALTEAGLVTVTDLGVTTKWGPENGLVWVTRLSSGAPVEGASVTLKRLKDGGAEEIFRGQSDALGMAAVPAAVGAALAKDGGRAFATVRAGSDWTFAGLPQAAPARPLAFLFTDRSLYRPGETVYLKGYVRTPGARALETEVGREVTVDLEDSEGHAFFEAKSALDAFGAFSLSAPIPAGAPFGYAHARARVVGSSGSDASTYFSINAYRALEFKVAASADRPAYVRGDSARMRVEGKYLFGTPMHGVEAQIEVTRQPTTVRAPGATDFSLGDDEAGKSSVLESTTLALGGDGRAEASVKLDLPGARGPENVELEAFVADVGQSFGAADRTSVLVHPGEFYSGVRAPRDLLRPGAKAHIDAIAVKPDGARVAGVPIHVALTLEQDKAEPEAVGACDVISRAAPVGCDFTAVRAGRYVARATAVDPRGNALVAADRFVVVAGAPPPPPPPPPPKKEPEPIPDFEARCKAPLQNDGSWVELEDPNRARAPGEAARVCVRAPRPGLTALVTIEREGVLRADVRKLAAKAQVIDVPITPDMYPDARIDVHVVAGRTAKIATSGADHGPPASFSGAAMIEVKAPEKTLAVEVTTAPEQRPGADAQIALKVKDGAGRPARAQVTLYAVDEGVLLLQPYRRPEPGDVFGAWRHASIATDDSRDRLYYERGRLAGSHRVKAPSIRQGATSVNPRELVARSKIVPVAWFMPQVLVDGQATVTAKLPDNVTTWRVFAVAATEGDEFGSAETTFVTNKPILTRAALPRFLREGDRFDATAIVDSLAKEPLAAKVRMEAWGAIVGGGARAFDLAAGAHEPVRFPLVAGLAGEATIRFRVDTRAPSDAVDTTIPVRPAYTIEALAFEGEARAKAKETIGELSAIRGDVGGLDLRLGATPLAAIGEGFAQLDEYPYGCTEQLVSRLVPLVMASALAKDLGLAFPGDARARAEEAVTKLLVHQREDGGFGLWPESRASSVHLTIYALWGLASARRAGVTVPERAFERAAAYLDGEETRPEDAAFREDVLAPHADKIRAIDRTRLSLFGRALLVHAAAAVDRELAASLVPEIERAIHASGAVARATDDDRSYLASDARATAVVLRALLAASPGHPLVPRLARGLVAMRKNGRWATTHDAAWALIALDEAHKSLGAAAPVDARVLLDDASVLGARLAPSGAPVVGHVPAERLLAAAGAPLVFEASGGPLYYEGLLRFARKELPRAPLEHGILVERIATPRAQGALQAGDYVDVALLVTTPIAREQVVLDDPLPAGFEGVDLSYRTTSRAAARADFGEGPFVHREMRDDRVVTFIDHLPAGTHRYTYVTRATTPGRFVLPPAKAECMYAPDVYGRTAASFVVVR